MRSSVHTSLFVVILLVVYLVNGLFYLPKQSITCDEGSHFDFGIRMLKGSTQRTDRVDLTSKLPVSALNVLPRAVEQLWNKGLKKTDNGVSDIVHGRYVTLLISMLIGLFVFKWTSELYGERAGLFSLFLFVFCPNCLAHAALVTTDSYSVLLLLLVMYYLWKYLSRGRAYKDFILFCVFTGVAQLVKQSLFHLYLIIPCLIAIHFFAYDRRKIAWRSLLINTGLFLLINLLVINAGFYFQGCGRSLGDYHFVSGLFQGLQRHSSFLSSVPLPLPASFVEGLDMAKYQESLGGGLSYGTFGNITVLGQSSSQGFWYFYFVICFFKTPIAVLVFLAWSCCRLVQEKSFREMAGNEVFLLLPVLYFFIVLDFFYKCQINIRHIIFIYPLLYIFCGILVHRPPSPRGKWAMVLLSVYYVVSVLFYFRNYIPYTNEFILDKKMAYRIVGADNLNMKQGDYFLQDYLAAHPDVTMATSTPRPGRQAVAVRDFLDIWNEHRFDWLKPFTPVGHIAHYYLIFDITPDELNKH